MFILAMRFAHNRLTPAFNVVFKNAELNPIRYNHFYSYIIVLSVKQIC